MYKIILSIVMIFACGIIGLNKSSTYKRRVQELKCIYDMIKIMRSEISYRKDPLPELFKRLASDRNSIDGKILMLCLNNLNIKMSFKESWNMAIETVFKSSALDISDKCILNDLGSQLGKSGIDGQTDILELTEIKLNQQIQTAESDIKTKGKMYSSMGFSIGIVAAVLLI